MEELETTQERGNWQRHATMLTGIFIIVMLLMLTGCAPRIVNETQTINNITTTTYVNETNNITNTIYNGTTTTINTTINETTIINNTYYFTAGNSTIQCNGTDKLSNISFNGSMISGVCTTDQTGGGTSTTTPWSNAIANGGYLIEYEYESVTAGYTGKYVPTAITAGTSALTNGSTIGSLNGVTIGAATVSSNATSQGGYSYQMSGITVFLLKEGSGTAACFRPVGLTTASTNGANYTSGRFGYMDIFTATAQVVDGGFINWTMVNSTHGILKGVVRNNSVANYTTTSLIITNATNLCGMIYADNTSIRFTVWQNGSSPSDGVSVWNDSINMYPWNQGRTTGHGTVNYAIQANSTGAQVIGEYSYLNAFNNKTIRR